MLCYFLYDIEEISEMLNFYFGISIIAGIFSFGLALWALVKDRHASAGWIFSLGMAILGIEVVLNGLSLSAYEPLEAYQWQKSRVFIGGFLPGIWLVFSLIFGNSDYKENIKKWKWGIGFFLFLPAALFLIFQRAFFVDVHTSFQKNLFLFRIGWAGYVFHIIVLIGIILILVHLERTLRSTSGRQRWQIKFVVLGLCGLWGERIYEISQTLLYREIDLELQALNVATVIIANGLILIGIKRMPSIHLSFYPSQAVLFNSVTILLVGIYFISVGVVAKIATYYSAGHEAMLGAFIIFLALLALPILIFSDRLKKRLKRFISLHFGRPTYDYQKEWIEFTGETSSILDIQVFCRIIAGRISRTLDVLSVTIWLVDESLKKAAIGGSTSISEKRKGTLPAHSAIILEMIQAIRGKNLPLEYNFLEGDWTEDKEKKQILAGERLEYCLPLKAGERYLGAVTLGERVGGDSFSVEDFELLKTITAQTAGSLLNLTLSEELRVAKEMEAFQKLSAFLLHDLKNLASTFSLTLQNMEAHFENPDFRKDAFKVLEQSLGKIKNMCSGLSLLSQRVESQKAPLDLNRLVCESVKEYDGTMKGKIIKKLTPTPEISVDADQIRKVLVNMVLNANDALRQGGEIRIETGQRNGWAVLSVKDNGCGMTKDFMEKSLFRPFKTTKRQGMGIGLFQSKMIVEAHGGRIEVESEENVGSTFRVLLPMK